jgi:glycosyltransferase involved in cell wall biosynthesis
MKVLWLTETPSKYKPEEYGYNGRGWIASLQTLVESSEEVSQLGIAFPHSSDTEKLVDNKTVYYPIKRKIPQNIVTWIASNWKRQIEKEEEIKSLEGIVKDFDPDIIHIFGTESWLCHVVKITRKPCIVHLQGLLGPYLNAYNPVDISNADLKSYSWVDYMKGVSIWHNKLIFEKKSRREDGFFKQISFYMGRTLWDKSISGFLSSGSTYYHVDEVLRENFYTAAPWVYNKNKKIIITSTISDALYKGLDLVIKTARLLNTENFEFEWRIIGVEENSKTALLLKKIFKADYSELNIKLKGIKNTDEIIELLSETLLYIHTSYIDNSPNSLCEAQIMGVPTMATNVGGISSLIEDGKDGFLVPANDPYFLASRIVQLSKNVSYLKEISNKGKEKAQKRHLKETILNQLIQSYNELSVTQNKVQINSNTLIQ